MAELYQNRHEYHADASRVSASMLKVFRRSRALYHAKYVAKSIPPEASTPRLELGTAAHVAVLEPDRWSELVAVAPDVDRRTRDGKDEYAAFLAEVNGRCVVSADQAAIAQSVGKAVRGARLTRFLVTGSDRRFEHPVVWQDQSTGVPCKALPDLWLPGAGAVVDLKTVSSSTPWDFAKSVASYGYAMQARHYLAATGAARFVWITASIEAPFEVAVFELDEPGMEQAERRYRETLSELGACVATNDWALEPTEVLKISLPAWA